MSASGIHNSLVSKLESAINNHDCKGLQELFTNVHSVIGPNGETISGQERILKFWQEHFQLFPDYSVKVYEVVCQSNVIVVFGVKKSTFLGIRLGILTKSYYLPFAWKLILQKDKFNSMQMFFDTKPISDSVNLWFK